VTIPLGDMLQRREVTKVLENRKSFKEPEETF